MGILNRFRRATSILVAALGLSACAASHSQEYQGAPRGTETHPAQAASPEAAQPGSPTRAASPGDQYIIGPGDKLRVVVAQNPDLNTEVPVRPDGKISTPLAGDVDAVGKTPMQLARDIEAALAVYVRAPSVSVIVSTPVGAFGQVRIVGRGVTAPRGVAFRSGMTVLDLVQEVGGISQFAAGNRAKIIRSDPRQKKPREINVHLDDLLNKGKVSENLALEPGDILVIPESWF